MKANFTKTSTDKSVSIGGLYQLETLREEFAQARYLEGNLPVLSCPIQKERAHLFSGGSAETRVAYGRLVLDDGHQLQTIQAQMGNLQFVWVADVSDAVVSGAIAVWGAVGHLPMMLRLYKDTTWQGLCGVLQAPTDAMDNDIHRGDDDSRSALERVSQLLETVASGRVEAQAKGIIPGAPLRHVFVNALVADPGLRRVDVSTLAPPGTKVFGL